MKPFTNSLKFSLLCFTFLCISCGNDKKSNETPKTNTETTTETEIVKENPENDTTYYAWVDNVNIRDTSETKGNVIGTYTSTDALTFTGKKSTKKEVIVVRGVAYEDYWLQVKTVDNKEGWVFGGVVKKEGETKGNKIITDNFLDFPHFGIYDLKTWENIGVRNEEAGDAETRTTTYLKDGKTLEVKNTDVGEYGYYREYVLKNSAQQILKERKFQFIVNMEDIENNVMELTETVKDHTTKKQYTRTQKLSKHFMQLSAKPIMVDGTWTESTLTVETALNEKTAFAKPMQIISSINELPNEFRDGCSCSFRTHPNDYATLLIVGTYEDAPKAKAIIKIDGTQVTLQSKKPENPNYKLGDVFKHYYNDQYDLKFSLTKDGQDDAGGPQYYGTAHLTSKDGSVNTDINIFGSCGC
ncbi:SH3 domain-containing protein [Kordia jejudonensis]|uniref:SH3 domain-containing protein n=1 Tax=Kordia jejudonensis TaxID=1348245 RepID=UPI00062997AE|nr:SH3 domain-containing protein [Kordia jejudonensis]